MQLDEEYIRGLYRHVEDLVTIAKKRAPVEAIAALENVLDVLDNNTTAGWSSPSLGEEVSDELVAGLLDWNIECFHARQDEAENKFFETDTYGEHFDEKRYAQGTMHAWQQAAHKLESLKFQLLHPRHGWLMLNDHYWNKGGDK